MPWALARYSTTIAQFQTPPIPNTAPGGPSWSPGALFAFLDMGGGLAYKDRVSEALLKEAGNARLSLIRPSGPSLVERRVQCPPSLIKRSRRADFRAG